MLSKIISGTIYGMNSRMIQVEVDASQGLPCFQIVGLPGSEVKEARERVKVALKNVGIRLPPLCININLSPADIPKSGTMFDLPMAVGVMAALSRLPQAAVKDTLLLGELGLSGELKPVRGVLPIVREVFRKGIKKCILPKENAWEGALIQGMEVIGVQDIVQAAAYLKDQEKGSTYVYVPRKENDVSDICDAGEKLDFADIRGQEGAKRAAQVAAAGFHHLLIIGPPGAGKTMLAKRLPTILPPLSLEESLEVAAIYSISGLLKSEQSLKTDRPFLNPHHTITGQALVGSGRIPRPGVISLAHRGVLFLGGYFCKTAETPNLRALWRFSYLEFFKKSAKTILHTTFWNCVLPLFDCFFAERFMVADYLMAKPYTIWQKEETKWRNYTRMAKGEGAYGI